MARGPGLSLAIAEKRFAGSGQPLLSDFALAMEPGSVVALIGPSGIGKSTLLRLIAGIDRDFSGRIEIDRVDAGDAPPPGFVFQDPRLLPWLTALENIRAADPDMKRDKALAALAQVGLAENADFYPRQMSGGMQRRVALARALGVNARLLLLDEPFVSLDRVLVDDIHQLLGRLIEAERPTVLFTSHLAGDAARLADRVVVLAGLPARTTHDLTFPVPRHARDRATLDQYTAQVEELAPRVA